MKAYEWKDGTSLEDSKNGAYWERNMLALLYADGWYYDTDNNWDGWKRVLSLKGGKVCFHIPDDFEVGDLSQINPAWDGHTTQQKWNGVARCFGVKLEW